ncbi:AAA family ATPase [Dyella sp. 20L07]|uniref:AAA family ATPase n=1 Tax=Dyella sp. 20L07 TaxID=3384240 RepID=UPI003D2ADFA7
MQVIASIVPIIKQEPRVNLLFYSPDERNAQRVAARLRNLATVLWEDSREFSPERWEQKRKEYRLVLLDYSCEAADGSTKLARHLSSIRADVLLLGVGSTASERGAGVLAALRAGVLDFVDMDASDDEIRTLLDDALQTATATDEAPAKVTRRRGRLVVLLGARPGMGASTLAAHLSVLVMPPAAEGAANPESKVMLLDLGQPEGDAALYLGVASNFHYGDALRNANRIDPTLVRTAMPHHASKLTVLSQAPGSQALPGDTPESALLIERLLELFDLVLCDLGGIADRHLPNDLLRTADEIWLIADQSIGSVISLDARVRELDQMQVRDQRVSLVMNRHDDSCGVSATQIAERFNLPLLAVVPERSHALRASANQGQLLHEAAPRDPYIRALAPLLSRLRPGATRPTDSSKWKKLFTRLGGVPWKSP